MKTSYKSLSIIVPVQALCAVFLTALVFTMLPTVAYASDNDLAAGTVADSSEESEQVTLIPMHRLYNMFSGEHFYTGSDYEKDYLAGIGWFYEGVGWQAPSTSNTPVYRLYNPNAGDHHYTMSAEERDSLVKVGWNDEGIGWYSDDAKTVPLYRQYNPNAQAGAHNFTCSQVENDHLVEVGWNAEGTAWYACDFGWSGETTWLSKTHLIAIASDVPSSSGIAFGYGTSLESGKLDRINQLIATDVPITFLAINARTGACIARGADEWFYGASTIKAPYVAALCKYNAPGLSMYIGAMQATIQWSSNEDFDTLVANYGTFYECAFANESNVDLNFYMSGTAYSYLTARNLARLWITIRDFILSNDVNSSLFSSFFNRGYFKEGWMYEGMLGGQLYHVGGIEGDVVYAVMTRYQYSDSRVWEIKDALVAAVS